MAVVLLEVEIAEVLAGRPPLKHVVDDDQDAVGDGHDGFLASEADEESVVLSDEVRVACPAGAVGRLNERGAQPRVRLPGRAAPARLPALSS